jgi:hypothetical protein
MNGYLKQIVENEPLDLYWFPLDIEEEIIKQAYIEYINDGVLDGFEDWWNSRNENKIERVFVEEIYV